MSRTMKAVIFKGPLKVEIEDRPVPTIQDPQDIILKVEYSALCGRLFPSSATLHTANMVQ
jgi:D-arabinose 1-dehydrogenase-like Zn-dependent alcohol dehydrogenase